MTDFVLPKYGESRTAKIASLTERLRLVIMQANQAEILCNAYKGIEGSLTNQLSGNDMVEYARNDVLNFIRQRIQESAEIALDKRALADKIDHELYHD
jgi:hypothetical protein